tara:strand:- start:789 stop:1379 length:591 start_codon:yes stop_codon:yes gene_type:complete
MSNVLNTLGYTKFLERRNQFTMNYSEIPRTFDRDIYSTLKSRQKFKKIEEVIVDIEKDGKEEEAPPEIKEIIIKDGKNKGLEPQKEKEKEPVKEEGEEKEPVKEKEKEPVKEKGKGEEKGEEKEPPIRLIDENEREFLFASKPEKGTEKEPEEIKTSHEATFQNETKEILQENKKRIVITEEALEDPKAKKSKKSK